MIHMGQLRGLTRTQIPFAALAIVRGPSLYDCGVVEEGTPRP